MGRASNGKWARRVARLMMLPQSSVDARLVRERFANSRPFHRALTAFRKSLRPGARVAA